MDAHQRPKTSAQEQGDALDGRTFAALFGVLQGGMWLLNDLESFLQPFRLSQGRFSILLSVMESKDGSVNPGEIARIAGKSRPTVSRMMERLLIDGLLVQELDADDGRRKRLSLTDDGAALLGAVIPGYNDRLRRISAELTDRDKMELVRILAKIDFLDPEKRIRPF